MSKILTILSTTAALAYAGMIPGAYAGAGEDAASLMTTYYSKKVKDCGVDRPAYLCSGLLIRGTQHGDSYKAWNPSPGSVKNGGVSFSYLRTDAKYDRLAYQMQNGYVISPPDATSAKELKVNVLCFYPLDALTDSRTDQGCGDHADTPEVEKMCNMTGIDSAQKWLNQFNGFPASKNQVTARRRSCGYDVKVSLGKEAVTNFNTVLEAMGLMGDTSFRKQNEIRLNTWEQNKQDSLPIIAFIYTNYRGLASARLDQRDLYNSSSDKRWIPIVHVTLPTVPTLDAKFTYDLKDQDIAPPGTTACSKFIESAVWGTAFVKEVKKSVAQLSITPTACGRTMSSTDISQAMKELTAYRNSDWDTSRDNSVAAQMRCLRGRYPDNDSWKIEPFRPYLSDMDTDKASCNPYGVPDLVVAEPTPAPSPSPTSPTTTPTPGVPPSSTETPQEILERITKNFNSQRTASNPCLEQTTGNKRGHYYCSGVLARTVGSVNYYPWDYSTNAYNMGSTSYSWLRSDIKSDRLMYPTGFIIRAPADAIARGLEPFDVGWECLYAFDAFTTLANGWRGCDFRGDNVQYPNTQLKLSNRNSANVYGSCGEVNVRTKADWLNFMKGKPASGQCSWDVEHPEYWDAMIEVQNTNTIYRETGWNEILLKNQNYTERQNLAAHIDAYFYDVRRTDPQSAGKLQYMSKTVTGRTVPILRMDLKAAPEQRFSYLKADQTIKCDTYIESSEWKEYVDRKGTKQWSLSVVPTPCGRSENLVKAYGILSLFFEELKKVNGDDARWKSQIQNTLITQLACNITAYSNAPNWSVEPARAWPPTLPHYGTNNCDPE